MSETNKTNEKLNYATAFIALINLALGVYITYTKFVTDEHLKEIEIATRLTKGNQELVSFDRDFKFKIYELAIDAIKSGNPKHQEAAYVAVNSMLTDAPFKTGLLNLFVKSNTVVESVKDAATVAKFDIKQTQQKRPIYSVANKIHVDIFYYQENEAFSKSAAKKLYSALASSDFYELGPIKPLTEKRNQSYPYNIKENEIRFDEQEQEKALALREIANQVLSESGIKMEVKKAAKGRPTKNYLSLFIIKDNSKGSFSDEFDNGFH